LPGFLALALLWRGIIDWPPLRSGGSILSWTLYLPIAGHSINMILLLGIGGGVGFLSGFFGVGGGFLMTPLLIMFGIPPVVAAASDSNQIVAATTSGSYAHYRMGNVDLKLGMFLLVGGLLGGTAGVQIIKILRQLGDADFFIRITYVVMLGLIGSYMLWESILSLRRIRLTRARSIRNRPAMRSADSPPADQSPLARWSRALPFQTRFERSGVTHSALLPLCLGILVGLLGAIMGLGGGFIMVPMMVYVLRVPMHVVVGTNLFQEVFMCANVTFMQALTNHTVDLPLALVLLVGSSIGAQFGARFSRRFEADELKILLACIILLVMVRMLLAVLLPPHILLDMKGVG
jgi:uncharacterized membrane protein YfcA